MSVLIDSLHDLSDELNFREMASALDRAEEAKTDAALAAWARAWGRPSVEALADLERD